MQSLTAVEVYDDKFNAKVIDPQTFQQIPDKFIDNFGCITVNGTDYAFSQRFPLICQKGVSTYNDISNFLNIYMTKQIEVYFTVKKIYQTPNYNIYSVTLFTKLNDNREFKLAIPLVPKLNANIDTKKWYDNCNILIREEDSSYTLIQKPPFSEGICFTFCHKSIISACEFKDGSILLDGIKYIKTHEVPTLHTFAFSGFFKPTLPEVYLQLPNSFNENKKFLMSTNLISEKPQICIQGDYHVAITTIWGEESN